MEIKLKEHGKYAKAYAEFTCPYCGCVFEVKGYLPDIINSLPEYSVGKENGTIYIQHRCIECTTMCLAAVTTIPADKRNRC